MQSAKPRGLLFGKFARLLAAAVFSVQIAALAAVLCGFFYTPGWMFVHYVLQPAITDDMATNVIVGFGIDFALICAVMYRLFGWIEIRWRKRSDRPV